MVILAGTEKTRAPLLQTHSSLRECFTERFVQCVLVRIGVNPIESSPSSGPPAQEESSARIYQAASWSRSCDRIPDVRESRAVADPTRNRSLKSLQERQMRSFFRPDSSTSLTNKMSSVPRCAHGFSTGILLNHVWNHFSFSSAGAVLRVTSRWASVVLSIGQ
jgi:hypothetical protein